MAVIDVVIVNYNTCKHLQACLDSIEREAANKVVVVDNASSDGSVEMVKSKYPWVTLLANKPNIGYGAAANKAIASCTAPYVLLLNSDTLLQAGTLNALSSYLDRNQRAGVVGPRLVDRHGTLEASCYPFPTPLDTLLENSTWAILCGRFIRRYVPIFRNLYLRTWVHNSARVVPWVKGAAMAIRREAFNAVGGFDECFFMFFEDADLCRRMTKAGWQIHFAPVTTVVHAGGASTKQVRSDMAVQLLRSTDLFYKRHSSRFSLLAMTAVVKTLMLAKWTIGYIRLAFARDPVTRNKIVQDIAAHRQAFIERRCRH